MMSSRVLLRLMAASILPSIVFPLPANAATKRKIHATTGASQPVRPNNGIIALPLNPVIPADQRVCGSRTASGLGYTMLRSSSGDRPGAGDFVLVNYIGYLSTSGAVFDQGQRSALRVDGVIPGFSEGLRMMGKGGIARLCIPAALGYGAQATGPIPANADLVFQIELVDYRSAAGSNDTPAMQSSDPTEQKNPASR